MIEEKIEKLTEDYQTVMKELDRLNKVALKLSGAIEILTEMKESDEPKKEK
tara:strand:- start:373 stop:525 length:153 start_codon:yes stop_codon:yes gene_type:complete